MWRRDKIGFILVLLRCTRVAGTRAFWRVAMTLSGVGIRKSVLIKMLTTVFKLNSALWEERKRMGVEFLKW